ncbi:MAG TPA: S8/S53 family peptidase [Actinomycetota bacterium]|nr:S8/S53 family peptidase [Actinomycetota bacterium]
MRARAALRLVVVLVTACIAAPALPASSAPGRGPSSARPVEDDRGTKLPDLPPDRSTDSGIGDATVVAILDEAFPPYHWDYVASKMPQARDDNAANDLPLTTAPDRWLPGFPDPASFKSYRPLELSLEERDALAPLPPLIEQDRKVWRSVEKSTPNRLNYYWMPGTKVIGAMHFGGTKIVADSFSHGTGTTSAAVGNVHGTCPECLLLFISIGNAESAERAISWALDQPWIDVVSNSYGHSNIEVLGQGVGKIYSGSDVVAQRKATERGQTIFFSAGNGIDNSFAVTNSTYMSSQKGPDWIVTVGGVGRYSNGSYAGVGRPADIAGVAGDYPSAYQAATVGSSGAIGFGGTSNAAPLIAGIYSRALYLARRDLKGPSRAQNGEVIARGENFACGNIRPECELGDGVLTAPELRTRLFLGAVHTTAGTSDPYDIAALPPVGEEEFLSEGHGSYLGRVFGTKADAWLKEFERLLGPLEGRAAALTRPAGEAEWMQVDSYCRQEMWGFWEGGYFVQGKVELPGASADAPIRSALENACPYLPEQ